ncbi:hypothetical protein ACEUZ9_002768 [Paracoccus litorisediminis]|uniref:hypothetical protein n=1 Tax=Paracoccus litorisediminis TaxID=2006130 RepID=UPI00372FF520
MQQTPTLIGTILEACMRLNDARTAHDVALRATISLGALARDATSGGHLASNAMDLAIDLLDHLQLHDAKIDEAALVASAYASVKDKSRPYTYYALGWGERDRPQAHLQDRVLHCMFRLGELHYGPDDDQAYRETIWRREVAHDAIRTCLQIIAGEQPGISDDELIELARQRLESRFGIAPGAPGRDA